MSSTIELASIIQNSQTTIVDVRQPAELTYGKAEGAINIPLHTIPLRIDEFKQMTGPILLYCQSGGRSSQAAIFLKAQGLQDVYNGGSLENMLMLQSTH